MTPGPEAQSGISELGQCQECVEGHRKPATGLGGAQAEEGEAKTGPRGTELSWAAGRSSQPNWTGGWARQGGCGSWEWGKQPHLTAELGFLDHQEVGNGFQKLGLPQSMPC